MPVRIALRASSRPAKTRRSYRNCARPAKDIAGAVEVHGVLEGLAAQAARKNTGLSAAEARATLGDKRGATGVRQRQVHWSWSATSA